MVSSTEVQEQGTCWRGAKMASTSPSSEILIQTLITRGWCFGDIDQVKTLIAIQSALNGDSTTVESIESELSNSDLRSIGGNSLPDSSLLRKSSHLQGPKVLQAITPTLSHTHKMFFFSLI